MPQLERALAQKRRPNTAINKFKKKKKIKKKKKNAMFVTNIQQYNYDQLDGLINVQYKLKCK